MTEQQPQQPAQGQPEDLSSKTILLLVILTLAVSFIGAWVNINTAMTATASQETAPSSTAEVSFYIQEPPVPQQTSATGMVSLTLTPPQ